jgi:antitoxin (DNA-binding transcriptional repressor) of toxin-antitoxin stability system
MPPRARRRVAQAEGVIEFARRPPLRSRRAPRSLVADSVIHVARRLMEAREARGYLDVPVLVPDIAGQTASTALDEAIAEHLPALSGVCMRPHDRLAVEHVLVRAALARRVPVPGLLRLASHSEDWAGIEFGRIVPQKLMAQRYTEDYDFYENQMAAQLVDRLRRYIAQRVADLLTLQRHLADLERYQKALEDGRLSHWTRHRLANLLAEAALESERQSAPVANALDWLTSLQVKVNMLRGSPLYRRANRHAAIPSRLCRTNLLTRDRRYHDTALLWEAWALRRSAESDAMTAQQRNFADAYIRYVTAIVVRACATLGMPPAEVSGPAGALAELGTADGIKLRLLTTAGGNLELSSDDVPVARIIPLPEDLTAGGSAAEADDAVAALLRSLRGADVPTIVAHPSDAHDRGHMPEALLRLMHWAGPLPPGPLPVGITAPAALHGVIPVTPLEIESTERMARALRWAWYAAWAEKAYPPGPDDRPAVLRQLTTCPLCRRTETVAFTPHDDTFHCRCECGGQWGTRICGSCKRKFPVFWARKSAVRKSGEGAGEDAIRRQDPYATGDRVDAVFGSEVLALPCPSFGDWTKFRCPWCGVCQGAPWCDCPAPAAQPAPPGQES